MNRCPGCGYIVPGAWTECRRCGAPLAFAPVAVPPPRPGTARPRPPASRRPRLGAAPTTRSLPGGAPDRRADAAARATRGPDTMLPYVEPIITVAPPRDAARSTVADDRDRRGRRGARDRRRVYSLIPHGRHHTTSAPTILTPQAPFAGIPTSLSGVVRIEAESSRHTALVGRDLGRGPERQRTLTLDAAARRCNPATSGSRATSRRRRTR